MGSGQRRVSAGLSNGNQEFRERAEVPDGRPHPHRRIEPAHIRWTETEGPNSPWFDVLFAAECMNKSALGLSRKDMEGWPDTIQHAYTKLSAGHVSADLVGSGESIPVPKPDEGDDHTRGKIARTAYWYEKLRDGYSRVAQGFQPTIGKTVDPRIEHPRVLAAVREIEEWTLKGEKVLVFGVFLEPLKLLLNVLNVRQALRAVDAGRPVTQAIDSDADIAWIAVHQLERLRSEDSLRGRLSSGTIEDMRSALETSYEAYRKLRKKLRKRARLTVEAWGADRSILGSEPLDASLETAVKDHLISFVLDDYLATASSSGEMSPARFGDLAEQFVRERLRPLLGEADGQNSDSDHREPQQSALRALIDDSGRQILHAQLLIGPTGLQARRYIQAAFNRPRASPWVIVAQSLVGREGLNLHEACRVVVQFHAEWNPAILEQQIGRVDRKGSLWERKAQEWMAGGAQGDPPYIEVRQLVFEGSYDAFQWDTVKRRKHDFDASLFGSLLPTEAWDRVPEERKQDLLKAAPSFRPAPLPRLDPRREA